MTRHLAILLLVFPVIFVSGLPTQRENEIEIVVKGTYANKDTPKEDIYPNQDVVAVPIYFPGFLQDRVLLLRIRIVDTIVDLNLFATVILGEDSTTDDVRDNLGAVLAVLDAISRSIDHNIVNLVTIGRARYQAKLNDLFDRRIFHCSIKALRHELFPSHVQKLRDIAGNHADTWVDILKDAANGTAQIISDYDRLRAEDIAQSLDLADLALRMTQYEWQRFSSDICRIVRAHEELVPPTYEQIDVSTPGTELLDDDPVVTESVQTGSKEILREALAERCPNAVTNADLQTCLLETLLKRAM